MNTDKLTTDFGARLVALRNGRHGLRGGLACEVREAGAEELEFIATDETLDRYHEVIKLDGWELEEYRRNPVVPDSHRYDSIAFLLGNSTDLQIKGGKMHNRVRFAMDNPLGAMAYRMAKKGFIHSESVGFIPKEWQRGKTDEEPNVTYVRQELIEISLVIVPANPGATVGAALKSGAITRADVRRVIELLEGFSQAKADDPVDSGARAGSLDGAQWLGLQAKLNAILARA